MPSHSFIIGLVVVLSASLSLEAQTQQQDTTSFRLAFPEFAYIKSPQEADSAYAFTLQQIIGTKAPFTPFQNIVDQSADSLSHYSGQVVLVNFWNRSCAPCIKEMPEISSLQDDYYQAGLRIVLIAPNDFETLGRFFAIHKTSAIKAMASPWAFSTPFRLLSGFNPTFVLIDRDGFIKDAWSGAIGYHAMEERINRLIPPSMKSTSYWFYAIVAGLGFLALSIACLLYFRLRNRHPKALDNQPMQPTKPSQ
jgi:thiol-disulfide isomerase/thioredoxin